MANQTKKTSPLDEIWLFVIVCVALIVLFGVGLFKNEPVLRWLAMTATMIWFVRVLGQKITGRPAGVLIDSRNKISISRLQMVVWTLLALSAYVTIALPRVLPGGLPDTLTYDQIIQCSAYWEEQEGEESKTKAQTIRDLAKEIKDLNVEIEGLDQDSTEAKDKKEQVEEKRTEATEQCPRQPLGIRFPPELVVAMGISTASLAGSTLIKGWKRGKEVSPEVVRKTNDRVRDLKKQLDEGYDKEVAGKTEPVPAARKVYLKAVNDVAKKKKEEEELAKTVEALRKEADDEAKKAVPDAKKLKDAQDALTAAEGKLKRVSNEYRQLLENQIDAMNKVDALEDDLAKAELDQAELQADPSILPENPDPMQASWADLFRMEERTKERNLDIGKIQMFLFTVVLVFAYAAALYGLMTKQHVLLSPVGFDFPAFSSSMNGLLVLSHAGYLGYKAAEQVPTKS
jgi:hypothetical protein